MKVIVAVASRHGSTEMIADCIHEELAYAGCQAYLLDVDAVTSLADYDAVVLGSAVYSGHWLKRAGKFASRFEAALRRMPVWLFSSGPVSAASPSTAPVEALEISARIGAREHRVFPGRIERDQLGLGERLRLRGFSGQSADDREWIEIGRWARSIAAALRAGTQAPAAAAHTETRRAA
ncbi:MAG TPA: flavodoxin domain-containing protein [Candidatus Limnocylindrales bacterium]|nr:flavodoxin domain-containing protein [Candidatus Limnocylindrales bacterium]